MTHTNHRLGERADLNHDYVVFMYAAKGFNDKDVGLKLQKFMKMGYVYQPVNAGPARTGDRFMVEPEKLPERILRSSSAYIVYDNREKAEALVKDLVKADMGISVVVSGLFDEVNCMCKNAGIKSHTIMGSLGVWGKTSLLPEDKEIMEIATMCGHSMIGFNLIKRMAFDVKSNRISLEKASQILARPCSCGIFNPERAKDLLQRYNERTTSQAPTK
jgi:hypothetical protein